MTKEKNSVPSRVYKEAATQIDMELQQQRMARNVMPRNMRYSPAYQGPDPAWAVADKILKSKRYDLYGKLAGSNSGTNVSFGILNIVEDREPLSPTERQVAHDLSKKEREEIKEMYATEKAEAKKSAAKAKTVGDKLDELAGQAKLAIAAATSMDEIEKLVSKFRSDVKEI